MELHWQRLQKHFSSFTVRLDKRGIHPKYLCNVRSEKGSKRTLYLVR